MADIITSIKRLNDKCRTSLYLIYGQFEIAAVSQKYDMDKFLQSDNNIVEACDDSLDNVTLIHGLVLDQTELPFDISDHIMEDRQLWLLVNEAPNCIIIDPYNDILSIINAIENYLDSRDGLGISDFAVILGEEIPVGLTVSKAGTHIQASKVYE
jgi:hypothetical protein